jgi:hypothetical protein
LQPRLLTSKEPAKPVVRFLFVDYRQKLHL